MKNVNVQLISHSPHTIHQTINPNPMWAATVLHQRVYPVPAISMCRPSKRFASSLFIYKPFRFGLFSRPTKLKVSSVKKQLPELPTQKPDSETEKKIGEIDSGWLPAFPHVLTASMANFLFGYHIGVMNGPIVSIARELGFEGNSILEGLVVSIFIAGAFIGSITSGSLVDKLGCRRTFQIVTIPLILGAILSAQAHSLDEILWGRLLVGFGIGVNSVLVPIYISEEQSMHTENTADHISSIFEFVSFSILLLLGVNSTAHFHLLRN